MIYLDNAATTKISDEVLESMLPYLQNEYGNPDSKYYSLAEHSKAAVDNSRREIAKFFGVDFDEVIFNSGATEGNNTVIKGVANSLKKKGKHLITTTVEHSSVYETMKFLENQEFEVTYLTVDQNCQIDLNELKRSIRPDTILVSIMWVNNEVGSIFPIDEISKICHEKDILFHTDATQAVGKLDVNLSNYIGVNFLTYSAHKIHGPKGVGALICRKDSLGIPLTIEPLIHGGDQEFGYRAGTLNTAGIVGLAKATSLINLNKSIEIKELEDLIIERLLYKYQDMVIINNQFEHAPGFINIRFKGINNQVLLKNLKDKLVASTGSACSNTKPSRTLLAMGLPINIVSESLRISLSSNNLCQVNELIDCITNL